MAKAKGAHYVDNKKLQRNLLRFGLNLIEMSFVIFAVEMNISKFVQWNFLLNFLRI